MRFWTMGLLVLSLLVALTACSQPQTGGAGEDPLLANGESSGPQEPPRL